LRVSTPTAASASVWPPRPPPRSRWPCHLPPPPPAARSTAPRTWRKRRRRGRSPCRHCLLRSVDHRLLPWERRRERWVPRRVQRRERRMRRRVHEFPRRRFRLLLVEQARTTPRAPRPARRLAVLLVNAALLLPPAPMLELVMVPLPTPLVAMPRRLGHLCLPHYPPPPPRRPCAVASASTPPCCSWTARRSCPAPRAWRNSTLSEGQA